MTRKMRTYKGREVDMEALVEANASQQAVGNIPVNARGDVIDERGRVVQRKEERAREYNTNVKKSVVKSSILDDIDEVPELKDDPRLAKKNSPKTSPKTSEKPSKVLGDQDFDLGTSGEKE